MSKKISLPIMNPEVDGTPAKPAAEKKELPPTRAEGGNVMTEIEREVSTHPVFLYMKGTPQMPQCGFSARVVQILEHLGVKYGSCNILEDFEKRSAIKEYSEWPTIPQLYIDGEFVGGSDIVTEMFQAGELQEALGLD